MATKVVNLKKEPYDVYIGRAGRGQDGYFGNPYRLMGDTDAEREASLRSYTSWFYSKLASDSTFKKRIEALKGKTLGCFCKPKACHGDVIVEYLEG